MARKSKEYDERELLQGRCFQTILYPDSSDYDCNALIDRLHPQGFWDKAWWILHDKDTYSELEVEEYKIKHPNEECPYKVGDKKKPHYHVVAYRETPMVLGSASDKFGVKSNHVQRVGNQKKAVQYLIYKANPEKYQYELSSLHVFGCSDKELQKIMTVEIDTMEKAKLLYDYIAGQPVCNMDMLVKFSFETGTWDELRRAQHIFTNLIKERNYRHDC